MGIENKQTDFEVCTCYSCREIHNQKTIIVKTYHLDHFSLIHVGISILMVPYNMLESKPSFEVLDFRMCNIVTRI